MKSNFYPGLSIIVFSFVLFNCLGKSPAGGKRIVAILQSGFSNSSSNNPGSGSNCCSGSFTIGGSVSGLSGGTVILTNTGNFEAKSISANGAFSFSTAIADNTAYSVVATSHPSMQNCSITNGSGTISSAIVTNIAVSCKLGNQYGPLVGGSIFSNLTLTPSLAPLNPGGFCALTNSSLALSQFNNPNGITTDGRYFYVADTGNQVIRRIDPITDAVTTIAGTAGVTGSADGGPGTGQFNALRGIATDGTYLYVADYWAFTIRRISIASGVIDTIAGVSAGWGNTDAGCTPPAACASRLLYPTGIVYLNGFLYFTESHNGGAESHIVRKIDLANFNVSLVAGSFANAGHADGIGSIARFNGPYGITTDGTYLYVTEELGNYIRRIDPVTNNVTTIAGTGSGPIADGIGLAAQMSLPKGMFSDGTYVYFLDSNSSMLRRLEIATNNVTTVLGGFTGALAGISDGQDLYISNSGVCQIGKVQ